METKQLTEAEVNHAKVITSLLRGYAEKDKATFDMLNTALSLIMSIEYITDRDLTSEEYHKQRNLIEHFQKNMTKQVVNIF